MCRRRWLVVLTLASACGRIGFGVLADGGGGGGSGDARDVAPPDASRDGAQVQSCIPTAPDFSLVYSSPTFSDFSTAWQTGGMGMWSVANGALVESRTNQPLAYAYHSAGYPDYRVTAHLHPTSSGIGDAVEIAFRMDGTTASMYHCNWEPTDTTLKIQRTDSSASGPELVVVPIPAANVPDPTNVDMEVQASGSTLECCLDGIAGAYATVVDATYAAGDVGVKTYDMSGQWSAFAVYY